MDKKSKVFLAVFSVMILFSVGVTFWRTVVKKDYIVEAQADCDPTTEKCFVQECDPATETCTGDPAKDTTYFKKVSKKASDIPLCDPNDENCKPLECSGGEKDCVITFCDDSTKSEEETCNDPEQYNADNPPADENAAVCDPESDENCTSDSSTDSTGE
jgi:hypothetical protein